MALELGARLVAKGSFASPELIFYLYTEEIVSAIKSTVPTLGALAEGRRQLREAYKQHQPPGTIPSVASENPGVKFKEVMIKNNDDSDTMRGFAVSSGAVTGKASVILGAADFEQMEPGSILVSPLTTPAWTQVRDLCLKR